MMAFHKNDRVKLTSSHVGIPAGSIGTVKSGTEVTTSVRFDIDPTRFVMCPNSILTLAGPIFAALKQHAFATTKAESAKSDDDSLFWHKPRFRPPHVGTSANFVATTATRNALSLLLEGAQLSLRGRTYSGTWIGSAEFPISGIAGKLTGQVRGAVSQSANTISDVILCIGGLTTRIVFDGVVSKEFTEDLSIDMQEATTVQTITIVLICDRQPNAEECLLAVDSIDLVRV